MSHLVGRLDYLSGLNLVNWILSLNVSGQMAVHGDRLQQSSF